MYLAKAFFVLTVLFGSFQICYGQERPKPRLVDEFGKLCSEELMARYDGFLIQMGNDPNANGYIIFYGDETLEGRNLNFIQALKNYPRMRKVDETRFVLLRGANRPQMHVQFWIVPAGADMPTPEKEFVQGKITSTTLFDRNWADFHRFFGELEIYHNSFLDLGCEFSPNISDFAKTLLSNPDLTGYLVVYTKFGKGIKRGNQVASFAVRDLMKNYKVPRTRLKTIYGGNHTEPEIELWFVPKGEKPPTPKPDTKMKK